MVISLLITHVDHTFLLHVMGDHPYGGNESVDHTCITFTWHIMGDHLYGGNESVDHAVMAVMGRVMIERKPGSKLL